ncbi:RNase P subunit p30 [Poronia punctata]|nr:RNase P subunit p30 [Poronia punctata]
MIYDLNILWSPQTSAPDLQRTLRFASSLGYGAVALNYVLGAPIPPQVTNPIPDFTQPAQQQPYSVFGPLSPLPTVLRRATVVLSESSQHHRLPQLASAFDILAVRPQSEESFTAACQSLNDVPIISLDLTVRQPFSFRPKNCMFAVKRGVCFEVCYSQLLTGPPRPHTLGLGYRNEPVGVTVDPRARAMFIGNLLSLVRATGGRGIILSSEAGNVTELRAPADVVNLFHIWGLRTELGMEAMRVLPRGIVKNEGLKRNGFRGVVEIVRVAERESADVDMGDADNKKENGGSQGGKRKGDDEASDVKMQNQDGGNPDQPLSKRQAKKIKAALRKKDQEQGKMEV